jgi:hypothetical protein
MFDQTSTGVLFQIAKEADRLLKSPDQFLWVEDSLIIDWGQDGHQRIENVDPECLRPIVAQMILNCTKDGAEFSERFRVMISLLGLSMGGALVEWAEVVLSLKT